MTRFEEVGKGVAFVVADKHYNPCSSFVAAAAVGIVLVVVAVYNTVAVVVATIEQKVGLATVVAIAEETVAYVVAVTTEATAVVAITEATVAAVVAVGNKSFEADHSFGQAVCSFYWLVAVVTEIDSDYSLNN